MFIISSLLAVGEIVQVQFPFMSTVALQDQPAFVVIFTVVPGSHVHTKIPHGDVDVITGTAGAELSTVTTGVLVLLLVFPAGSVMVIG